MISVDSVTNGISNLMSSIGKNLCHFGRVSIAIYFTVSDIHILKMASIVLPICADFHI